MGEEIWTDYEFYTEDVETYTLLIEQVEQHLRPECFDTFDDGTIRAQGICNYGFDENIERWCVEHEVAFNVTIESKYDIQGTTRWWRPGMAARNRYLPGKSVDVTQEKHPVVAIHTVMEKIEAAATNGNAAGTIDHIIDWLKMLLPPPLDKRYDTEA